MNTCTEQNLCLSKSQVSAADTAPCGMQYVIKEIGEKKFIHGNEQSGFISFSIHTETLLLHNLGFACKCSPMLLVEGSVGLCSQHQPSVRTTLHSKEEFCPSFSFRQ